MLQAFTKPYCQMTAIDGLIIGVPILLLTFVYFWWIERKK